MVEAITYSSAVSLIINFEQPSSYCEVVHYQTSQPLYQLVHAKHINNTWRTGHLLLLL